MKGGGTALYPLESETSNYFKSLITISDQTKVCQGRSSSVNIVTRLRVGLQGFDSRQEQGALSSPPLCSDRL
jgi:hypothetical protein